MKPHLYNKKNIKSNKNNYFSDINESFAKYEIISLANSWIVKWYKDNTFRPNDKISRAEFLSLAIKTLHIQVDENATKTHFSDIPKNSIWMVKYIEKAKELNIISWEKINWKIYFHPNDAITRAEAVKIVMKVN